MSLSYVPLYQSEQCPSIPAECRTAQAHDALFTLWTQLDWELGVSMSAGEMHTHLLHVRAHMRPRTHKHAHTDTDTNTHAPAHTVPASLSRGVTVKQCSRHSVVQRRFDTFPLVGRVPSRRLSTEARTADLRGNVKKAQQSGCSVQFSPASPTSHYCAASSF